MEKFSKNVSLFLTLTVFDTVLCPNMQPFTGSSISNRSIMGYEHKARAEPTAPTIMLSFGRMHWQDAVVDTKEASNPSINKSTWHFFVAMSEIMIEVQPPPMLLSTVTMADLNMKDIYTKDCVI